MREHNFNVPKRDAGSRIDKWLTKALRLPRNKVKHLLDNGRILVNDRRVVIAGWELEVGDRVTARIPSERRVAEPESEKPPQQAPKPRRKREEYHRPVDRVRRSAFRNIGKPTLSYEKERTLKDEARGLQKKKGRKQRRKKEKIKYLKVYHQDKHIIVVEKPAGLLTVPQKGSEHPHLVDQVKAFLKRKYPHAKHSYVQPLHRLDNETSGIVVLATSKAGEKLTQQFKNHTVNRRYLACVHGTVEKQEGMIEAPLEKGRFGKGKKVRPAQGGEGKFARTNYRVKERYTKATFLDVSVTTGRTHQVRVHLASKGHPLIGDKTYAEHHHHQAIPFSRQALHAHVLGFRHPVTGKRMTFHSPLPDDMKKLLDELRTS